MRRLQRLTSTVRFRVTALATIAVAAVLIVTGFALVANQRRVLTENLDEALAAEADALGGQTSFDAYLERNTFGDDDAFVQVVAGGDVIAATANVRGRPGVAEAPPADGRDVIRTVDPGLEADYRVLSRDVGRVVLHVGVPLDDVEESTGLLAGALGVAVPLTTLVLAGLVWLLVGRALRPVEAIRSEVAGIDAAELDRRVSEPPSDDEVARLARTMNAMLDRIEEATDRQRRFVADASHELRSPLTRMRTEVEVDLAHPVGADLAATHRSVLEEVTGLQRLVDDLLHLARSDAGAATVGDDTVDLDVLVARAANRVRADGRVRVDVTGVSPAQARGDAAQLGRAIDNVADNARRHARSTVALSLGTFDRQVRLTVADDGPGIPAEQRERIFERFTRLDGARSAATGGAGLGLAIARDIAERHGGTLVVDSAEGGGARFVLTLPAVSGG